MADNLLMVTLEHMQAINCKMLQQLFGQPQHLMLQLQRCKSTLYGVHLNYEKVIEEFDYTKNKHFKQGKFQHQSLLLLF